MDASTKQQYLADNPPTIVPLVIKEHFDALGPNEQSYAHYISRACFAGTRIVLRQVSPESESIYDFIVALHNSCGGMLIIPNRRRFLYDVANLIFQGDYSKVKEQTGVSDEDLTLYLGYAAQVLGNAGNYKSFGDSKFIPRITADSFEALAKFSQELLKHYELFKDALYETKTPGHMHLGYPPTHITTYYPESADITAEEITVVSDFLKEKKLLPENTRLRKLASGDFEVLIASAEQTPPQSSKDVSEDSWTLEIDPVKGKKVSLVFGDHAREMNNIAGALEQAQKHSSNDLQRSMHGEYVKSFKHGSMNAHVESQRHWIHDKGPEVECNIGFIETYRDPHGIRGEWEGFAAMVNKERTRAFGELVASAPSQIPKLPWSKEFEKDQFMSPDFTSLEVLSFAGSGIPVSFSIIPFTCD